MNRERFPGEWRELRNDSALSGHQPLAGAIERPTVLWRHYLGGTHFDAEPVLLGDGYGLLLLFGGVIHCYDIVGNLIWRSVAMGFEGISAVVDLDGDGRREIVAGNGKTLFVLSASSGEILWSAYLGPPAACGFMHSAALVHHFPSVGSGMQIVVGLLSSNEVLLFDCSHGAERIERVRTLWMDDFFHPSILVLDIDNDGDDEIVVTKYSAIYAFDPATGREKSVCRWASGGTPKRNYGLFLAAGITGTAAPDFVVLSEKVSKHISVVANNGTGELSLLWDRFLEHIYPVDQRELRYTFNSVVDVDGDGRPEIVVSFFDETAGGVWWLEVIDAATGEMRQRIDNLFLHGIQDLLDDEAPFVCATLQYARIPSRSATAGLWQWQNGELREVALVPGTTFAGRFLRQSASRTSFRADLPASSEAWTMRTAFGSGLLLIDSRHVLSFLACVEGEWKQTPIPCAIEVHAVLVVFDLNGDGHDEIVVSDDRGEIRVIDRAGESLGRIRGGMRFRYGTGAYYRSKPMSTAVFASNDSGRWLAVPDAGSRVHLLELSGERGRPVVRWQKEGRGRSGPEESYHAVGFRPEGDSFAVLMSAMEGSHAALVAFGLDGEIVWRKEVPELPHSEPFDVDRIGIHDYQIASEGGREILFISGYRSASMNSEESFAVDLLSEDEFWRRDSIGLGEHGRGFGPWNVSSRHRTPDQTLLLFMAKDSVCLTDFLTGALQAKPWQLRSFNTTHLKRRGLVVDDFVAYGSLIPCDIDGDGLLELVISGAYGGFGIIGRYGNIRWWQSAPLSTLSGAFFGIADVDGDDRSDIGMSLSDGDFVCVRADDGMEKWRIHIGEVATDVITCDIDGDGKIEFIATTQQGSLLCIGTGASGSGLLKWRLDLGYSLGPPIAADIDGDGFSEIVVVSGDGSIYAIGRERRPEA